jgi:DNA-binding HxlR family transcriptional regulator
MKNTMTRRSNCPINYALEEFGDLWSLLIIRDIMLFGKTTYGEFLSSNEKIATNILASRLEKLIHNGIIRKRKDHSDKRKDNYQLTRKGQDLYLIIKEMMLWSKKYDRDTELSDELAKILREEGQVVAENTFKQIISNQKTKSS